MAASAPPLALVSGTTAGIGLADEAPSIIEDPLGRTTAASPVSRSLHESRHADRLRATGSLGSRRSAYTNSTVQYRTFLLEEGPLGSSRTAIQDFSVLLWGSDATGLHMCLTQTP